MRIPMIVVLLISFGIVYEISEQQRKESKPRPDLNGQWVLDKSKGDVTEYSGLTFDMDVTLKIVHQEPEIRITRTYHSEGDLNRQELVYFSDERGETNPTIIGEVVKSKSKWNGDKLVAKSSGEGEWAPKVIVLYDRVDEWKLSKDGNVLTNVTRIYNARSRRGEPLLTTSGHNVPAPFGRSETKRVFRRSLQN